MAASFLKEFLASSDWQQMQNALEEAIGASVLWVVSDSGRSVQKADDRYPELCQLIRETQEGLRRCRNSHRARFQEVRRNGAPVVSECFCGFVGFALPLMMDDEIIGVAGGCHHQTVSPITMEKCAELSSACNADLKAIMDLAKSIKHMPKVEQKRLLTTLLMFTDMIAVPLRCRNEMNALFLTLNVEDHYAARLSFLSEIVKLAASELDWEEMLDTITGKTKSVLSVDACSVYILEEHHRELSLVATDGLPTRHVGRRIKVGEGVTGHVAETREVVAVEDATRDPRFKSLTGSSATDRKRSWVYRSVLSVPLVAQDRLIGVIDVRTLKPKRWSQADIDFLSIIAEHVAGIIEKDKYRMEISRELEAARFIQTKLLPDPLPEVAGYDLAALIVPNKQVGGDYYDLISMGKDRLGIVVADVAGKGIGAAILMANIQGLVNAYTYAQSEIKTQDAMTNINDVLCESTESDKFVTMFCAILDAKTGALTYTNAGHNHPFIYRVGRKKPKALDVGGMVLGMIKDTTYSEGSVKLKKGDILVLYSDGVTEARNLNGDMFDVERLHGVVRKYMAANSDSFNAKQLLDQIYNAVRKFSASASLADDLTIVVLIST
jgi:sigma-B regulation protein RsbU (phosphoserine phosphatase)